MKGLFGTLTAIFTLLFLIWTGARIINAIQFNRNCEGYLKRAADANTIKLAEQNLKEALNYAEKNTLTSGYTSILWRTPDEDVGFWYQNLKAALTELETLSPEVTPLERSNMLIKLRETLVDHGQSTTVTVPPGISVFPANILYAVLGVLSASAACVFGAFLFLVVENDW